MERESGRDDDPIRLIEAKIASGEIEEDQVARARTLWERDLRDGVVMPTGERVTITERSLYHVLSDERVRRRPERIAQLLAGVFELRTANFGRRRGLSEWFEDEAVRFGFAILDSDGHLRTMHLIDARSMRKKSRQGERLWRRGEHP